jgi:hypothetical protein
MSDDWKVIRMLIIAMVVALLVGLWIRSENNSSVCYDELSQPRDCSYDGPPVDTGEE